MSYTIITEDLDEPQNKDALVYATRGDAETALQQYLTYIQAAGAIIEADQSIGYVIRWQDRGHPVSIPLRIAPVQ